MDHAVSTAADANSVIQGSADNQALSTKTTRTQPSSSSFSNDLESVTTDVVARSTQVLTTRPCCVGNFRQAWGLPRIYRCASTDALATVLSADGNDETQTSPSSAFFLHNDERIVLEDTGLILDLRSKSERNEGLANTWTRLVSFNVQDVEPNTHVLSSTDDTNDTQHCGRVLRIDVLSPTRFVKYAHDNWLTTSQRTMANLYSIFDVDKVHAMRIDALNERGLTGLNEVILETGGRELCIALQEITLFLERSTDNNNNNNVVIHCVQGKDRTGMLVLLCQSILNVSDEEIVQDYHKSDTMRTISSSSASTRSGSTSQQRPSTLSSRRRRRVQGKLDRNVFAGAPREACVETLNFVRTKYGSVSPGYLNSIGFNEGWRQRFRFAIQEEVPSSLPSRSKL